MSKESRLIKNTTIIAIGNIFMKLVSFIMLPLYTAILSTSEYGTVDFVMATGSLVFNVLCLQLQKGLFRYLVEARGDKEKIESVFSTTYVALLVIAAIFGVLMLMIRPHIGYDYLLFIAAHAVLAVFSDASLHAARGLGDNLTYTVGSCANGTVNVVLNVLFVAVMRLGVKGMLYAELIAACFSIGYPLVRLRMWKYIFPKAFDKMLLRQLLQYSLPLIPFTLCWWLISAFGRLQVNLVLGASAAGIYAVANKFPSTFSLVTNVFYTSWSESAAENVDDFGRNVYYHSILDKAIRFYSSANLAIVAVMPFAFSVLVNGNYDDARQYIPIMMTAALLSGVANLFGSVYSALKRTKEIAWTTVVATILSVAVNVALIPVIGLYAAALSLLVANGLIAIIQYLGVKKMVNFKLSWRFLMAEGAVYTVVVLVYYAQNALLQLVALIALVPFCIFRNREILHAIWKKVRSKMIK